MRILVKYSNFICGLILLVIYNSSSLFGQDVLKELSYEYHKDFMILDTASGDFNEDLRRDYVVILKHVNESKDPQQLRPLIILFGNERGTFDLIAKNDSVVYCAGCGGVMGDPYQGISVEKNYFIVRHYGGSSLRWSREISFSYNRSEKAFLLKADESEFFHATDPEKITRSVHHEQENGTLLFEKYSNAN